MSIDPRNLPEMPSLMIAGPGELHEEELKVLGSQVIAHYGDVWTGLHNDAVAAVGELVGAADAPYVVPGTGTTCRDAAVFNVFEPGQRVVVAHTGFFGNRLLEIARQHRLEVTEVPVDVGAPVNPGRVADVVDGADGVLLCHVDTATGVRHPIAEVAAVANGAGAASVVDGIASVGGDLVDVDGMGLAALVTGSQKGLEAPPGLGILALGSRGRERVEARSSRPESWYLDLKVW
ncbi:MAG TPA: aminotransferase class V-fold PLP-dependent enzyme, partial [Actinomycetota bacterium]|nr:aminotransferase class V-fold PLP-dependent enzyme [Actinomycetota bacterium]